MNTATANVQLLMNYRRMRSIKRCNNFPVLLKEDVAQHSYFTTLFALTLADEYNSWATEHNIQYHPLDVDNQKCHVNVETLLRKSLLHDTDEVFTSDIPWNIKHMNEETHQVIEAAISKRVDEAYENAGKLMDMYKNTARSCKEGFEGKLLNIVDMLELAVYCYEEYTLGNAWIEPLFVKSLGLVESFCKDTDFYSGCPTLRHFISLLSAYKDKEQVNQLIDIN